jgi:hypothetical protein
MTTPSPDRVLDRLIVRASGEALAHHLQLLAEATQTTSFLDSK